ncbi:Fe(3+)-hydroxamate ABC transporter permease FhuB [Vibrio aestuarianus]|uniref:Fe(3+)-hydroxamate ABC transporter permease FhuB n=1 Tax=Vibrio aestuarianus TaxID=28171 RepID=UPI00237CF0C8|nr:Fe(3+)-hydroxamate ABC transporter permease FhuB [Vibrio aestuarianus]MDE1232399.1 Fe(3+)-hydroxamate ABC transporter permease FhuB [Vibrio aestuarianus]
MSPSLSLAVNYRHSKWLLCAIFCFGLIASLLQLSIPYHQGLPLLWQTLFHYDANNYQHLIVNLTYLPRLAMAVLCGFGLAVAGSVMQYVLRNPIASPTTLGVASGAELGMVLGILFLPSSFSISGFIPAFFGGCFATLLVFLLSAKRGFAPIHMVLAGMVISLFFGSLNTMLLLLNEQKLTSVFVWGAGALNQNGWRSVIFLLPMISVPVALLLLLQRPLASLQLGDSVSASLGVKVKQVKVACLVLAIFITAAIVSEVSLIGFIGIVAPAIARMFGARKLPVQLLSSGIIGSAMLLLADLIVQPLSGVGGELLPTGAMTALLGAPFLLLLLQRQIFKSDLKAREVVIQTYRHISFSKSVLFLTLILVILVLLSLFVGQGQTGWYISIDANIIALRWPRVFVALFAGMGLAIAGTIIQRVTTNPMASPEILGISSGAALALVIGALSGVAIERHQQMLLGTVGALSVTAIIWLLARKHQFSPTQMLLSGIALSAGLDAVLRISLASGQDNVQGLLTWLSGSTYLVTTIDIWIVACAVLVIGCGVVCTHRWLDIIGLSSVTASSIGVNVRWVRQVLLLMVALLTTVCTIVIGPLSFIGLLAPHMARSLGQYSALKQVIVASFLGALIMVIADWTGRTLWFPWQFPAGLLASVFGGAYFLYLMRK